ncbi:DUF262 domain-containing protein [Salmonella enterica]|uniref:DUF262 domain-containing protein n=1 Tax=Salmonella enterica TaxID=28901 RepID=A0A5Z4XG15_SALER|nr:DUF262 domain-containing protein [Salmonella enterica]ECH9507481.1 DUF262 domain-containing protein [Salmonella enterica subsp. enterica serovar Newport]EAS1512340.1 DUF262 domain-containing protein [Salmonella enterica]EAZ6790175.1 DUF262 domain-containing protein [Salmonella enterica]EBB9848168.1 DUF262 domain-containing protein [Salmonella enterica]
MNLKELLNDISKLTGLILQPVNANSDKLSLIELDQNTGKYYVKPATGKKVSRNIYEFEHVLKDLLEFGYANVESSLGGSGSSRQHPETIISNLPYIEFFKYKNKKHILLVDKPSHELGTLKEASGNDLKKARAALAAREKLSFYEIHENLKFVNGLINNSLQEIRTKYPGELKQEGISQCINVLNSLEYEFSQIFFKSHNILKDAKSEYLPSIYDNKESDTFSLKDEDDSDNESEDVFENESVNFDRKNLKIRQIVMSFSLIYDRIQYKEIELQPDFQRKERVWSPKEKSLLIESILLGLPIPMFYFAEREDGTWLIVDGLQRTTTIFDYMRGEFVLTDLKYFKDPEDSVYRKSFQDLPRQYQRKIREYQINGHLISVEKNDFEMVRELFQRINTYGRVLSPQEIRCALNPGSSIPFIRYLAETPEFINATFGKVNDKRMKDMEYVLGIISHILFGYKNYNFNREDEFLVNTMQYLNKYNFKLNGKFSDEKPKVLPEWNSSECDHLFYILFEKFKNGLYVSAEIFDSLRFKKKNSESLNKQLVIMLVSVFALLPSEISDRIILEKEEFINEFEKLVSGETPAFVPWISESYNDQKDKDFEYSISQSTGKKATILYRFSNFVELIKKFTGQDIIIEGITKDAN